MKDMQNLNLFANNKINVFLLGIAKNWNIKGIFNLGSDLVKKFDGKHIAERKQTGKYFII